MDGLPVATTARLFALCAPDGLMLPRATEPFAKWKQVFGRQNPRGNAPVGSRNFGRDQNAGVAAFINYLSNDPKGWEKWPEKARQDTLKNAHEWDVMLTEGEPFPDLKSEEVKGIKAPTLLLSGNMTFEFLKLIDEELGRLLPNNHRIVLPGATHHMFYEEPEKCRSVIVGFFARELTARPLRFLSSALIQGAIPRPYQGG